MEHLIGIDIGGTKTAVLLGRQEKGEIRVLRRIAFATETQKGPEYALGRIYEAVDELLPIKSGEAREVRGIGVSCGGPLDSRRGVVLSPPNLPGWDAIPIVELLEKRFGLPARLQNDANACALAEWRWGAARGCKDAVFLTFGTGMGAGLILGGRLHTGACDMAGEVGHIRLSEEGPVGYGKAGSFEGYCSGGGIARLARGACGLDQIDAKRLAEAARAGDQVALEIFRTCAKYLGRGLAVLVDILNPEVIVIGSIFTRCQDLLWEAAKEELERESLGISLRACRVLPSQLGDAIGDLAALATALPG